MASARLRTPTDDRELFVLPLRCCRVEWWLKDMMRCDERISNGFCVKELNPSSGLTELLPDLLGLLATLLCVFAVPGSAVNALDPCYSTRCTLRHQRYSGLTSFLRHILRSFLAWLQPPVHLAQLLAWQASRA